MIPRQPSQTPPRLRQSLAVAFTRGWGIKDEFIFCFLTTTASQDLWQHVHPLGPEFARMGEGLPSISGRLPRSTAPLDQRVGRPGVPWLTQPTNPEIVPSFWLAHLERLWPRRRIQCWPLSPLSPMRTSLWSTLIHGIPRWARCFSTSLSKRLKRKTAWTTGVSSSLGRGPGGIIISERDAHAKQFAVTKGEEKKRFPVRDSSACVS